MTKDSTDPFADLRLRALIEHEAAWAVFLEDHDRKLPDDDSWRPEWLDFLIKYCPMVLALSEAVAVQRGVVMPSARTAAGNIH
jgi:hypothetical protein